MADTSSAVFDPPRFQPTVSQHWQVSNQEESMDQPTTEHPFETGLHRHPANFVPLSPISFLRRSAAAFRDKIAVIDGERRLTYGDLYERCVRLASALAQCGVGRLDTVAIL